VQVRGANGCARKSKSGQQNQWVKKKLAVQELDLWKYEAWLSYQQEKQRKTRMPGRLLDRAGIEFCTSCGWQCDGRNRTRLLMEGMDGK
jgi:hypothetical protein